VVADGALPRRLDSDLSGRFLFISLKVFLKTEINNPVPFVAKIMLRQKSEPLGDLAVITMFGRNLNCKRRAGVPPDIAKS